MLKKVILCGAILLSFSDADCMNFRRSDLSEEERQQVIQIGDAYRAQNPGGRIPWKALLHANGIDLDPRVVTGYYSDLKRNRKNHGDHSEEEKRQIIQIGDAYKEQNPGGDIPWTVLLRVNGIDSDPYWACRYYFYARRRQIIQIGDAYGAQTPGGRTPWTPFFRRRMAGLNLAWVSGQQRSRRSRRPRLTEPQSPVPLIPVDQDAWELPELPVDPIDQIDPVDQIDPDEQGFSSCWY
jgi:hypothetical protein